MRGPLLGLALFAVPTTAAIAASEAATGNGRLQPYQMVRSLQSVQDRIADGDHAALPMQNKLLELIDSRLHQADAAEFTERRNFDALLIYAMSGGNPATVAVALKGLTLDAADAAAAAAVLSYLTGDFASASAAMTSIRGADFPHEVAAFLALVKGSILANDDADAAITLLDQARLLAPGTLVEEAALRRTLSLAVTAGDGERFTRVSEQYARRFLRSPYAVQFVQTFVSGIVALRGNLDLARITDAVSWMTQEQADTIYLRIARQAAIEGDGELLAFASGHNGRDPANTNPGSDPRKELYSSIFAVRSEAVGDVLGELSELDATQLSPADKALLDAARAVASEVVAPVAPAPFRPATQPTDAGESPEMTGQDLKAPSIKAQVEDVSEKAIPAAEATDASTLSLVQAARKRLAEIDQMLEESEP